MCTIVLSQQERGYTYKMNLAKFKGKLAEKNINRKELCSLWGKTRQTVANKVNGKAPITVDEAQKFSELAELTDQEKVEIFLT